jgi:hypothetical protein
MYQYYQYKLKGCSNLKFEYCRSTTKLSLKSPSLSPPILSAFTPYPLFEWYPQSNEILLNFSMKCCNSAFTAQSLTLIIVLLQVGAVKALRKNERGDETQFTTKIGGKTNLGSIYVVV